MPVWLLALERDGIIDRGRNALRLERGGEPIAPSGCEPDGVLRPYRALDQLGHNGDVGEAGAVTPRDALARDDLLGKDFQLFDQHRRLDGIEPAVETNAHAIVFVASFAMYAQAADRLRELFVTGEHRSAVAIAAERLRRKEAGGRCRRQGAETAIL